MLVLLASTLHSVVVSSDIGPLLRFNQFADRLSSYIGDAAGDLVFRFQTRKPSDNGRLGPADSAFVCIHLHLCSNTA